MSVEIMVTWEHYIKFLLVNYMYAFLYVGQIPKQLTRKNIPLNIIISGATVH